MLYKKAGIVVELRRGKKKAKLLSGRRRHTDVAFLELDWTASVGVSRRISCLILVGGGRHFVLVSRSSGSSSSQSVSQSVMERQGAGDRSYVNTANCWRRRRYGVSSPTDVVRGRCAMNWAKLVFMVGSDILS